MITESINQNSLHLPRNPWRHRHPALQSSFFSKIDPPKDIKDAQHLYKVCQQTVIDYDDQIKILDLKVKEKEAALVDCPYFEEQLKKMRGQMITLMESRRYYRNKGLAYEYYIDKTNLV